MDYDYDYDYDYDFYGMLMFMKRILDIVGALPGGVLLSPLLAVVWLAVVLESGLPGLFRQRRMGRGGSEFTLYKFRTMTVQRGTEQGLSLIHI